MTTSSKEPTPADREPAEGSADVPPREPEPEPEGGVERAADDIEQFLDVDPPESPASEAEIPAPPG